MTARYPVAHLHVLLDRIDALQTLLAVYRTNGRPTEKLFARLERTEAAEKQVRAQLVIPR